MDKKPVGRPKRYDSPAEKVGAYRRRLESAGLMRKEVLVTQETWGLVTEMAKDTGVSVSDAASGLLEHGAKAYATKKAKKAANPIEEFFIKRREMVQPVAADADSGKKPR